MKFKICEIIWCAVFFIYDIAIMAQRIAEKHWFSAGFLGALAVAMLLMLIFWIKVLVESSFDKRIQKLLDGILDIVKANEIKKSSEK